MEMTINGVQHEVTSGPGTPLLYVLRDELGLTGTKIGCAAGICGACTIHIDGVATRSCVTPLASAAGKQIRTIEGLAAVSANGDLRLHPVQQAFVDHQVPQCGWCMSGQIMTAAAFLDKTPAPGPNEISDALGNNYCRCGCYARIQRAVEAAAAATVSTRSQEVPA
jgi:isoquinoline 1-oxidoreductase alpha subunit